MYWTYLSTSQVFLDRFQVWLFSGSGFMVLTGFRFWACEGVDEENRCCLMGLEQGCLSLRSPFLHSWRRAVDGRFFCSRSPPSFRDRTLHPVMFLCRVWRLECPSWSLPPGISGLSGASFFV